jgi:CDP-diacylglycerol--serine O-phosphatidyltransferase
MKQITPDHPRHPSIYLLPNLLTMGALFAGFYAIVAATKHAYDNAAIAIFIALILDGLDGRIARLTHSSSDFGAHFDSLSDMLCFGITPALVLYVWSLSTLGKVGWLLCFAYTAATALRLARFNTHLANPDKRYFQGLSTTISAGFVASLLWTFVQHEVDGPSVAWLIAIVTILLTILKVSSIRYRSFKDLNLRGKVPFLVIPIIGLILVLISVSPPHALLILFSLYIASGPLGQLLKWLRPDKAKNSKDKNEQLTH